MNLLNRLQTIQDSWKLISSVGLSAQGTRCVRKSIKSLNAASYYNKNVYPLTEVFKKSSDKLFILGSGPSISTHEAEHNSEIMRNDSWAFNYFMSDDITPRIHFIQGERERTHANKEAMEKFVREFSLKTPRPLVYARGDVVNNLYFVESRIGSCFYPIVEYYIPEIPISVNQQLLPDKIVENLYAKGFFESTRKNVPKFRSTVLMLVSLALILKYKEIILCGVDMGNRLHFYESDVSSSAERQNLERIRHPHAHGPFSVPNYLIALQKNVARQEGAKVYVGQDRGCLKDILPVYW